ncbi:MAG: helix-turn-helix transcriptional regulator [Paracoccaceae bacterium]
MPRTKRTPTQLRMIFGENLRQLSRNYRSISELSRQLGINRTQFNRYLSGESFPRPDVLDRICNFFGTDARILLHPVSAISRPTTHLGSDFLQDFLPLDRGALGEDVLPSGLYQFTCRTGTEPAGILTGLILVFRRAGGMLVRGYATLPPAGRAEFRGYVTRLQDGLMLVTSRRDTQSCAATFLSRVPEADAPTWSGHQVLNRPGTDGRLVSRVIYEHLEHDQARILSAARRRGTVNSGQLSGLQKAHLGEDQALT